MRKIAYVIAIVLAIILGIVIIKSVTKNEKNAISTLKQSENTLKQDLELVASNTIQKNEVSINEDNATNEANVIDEEIINSNMSDEEKAKEIVRRDWGEDSTIYLNVERKIEEGKYEIGIRERSTTKILYRYTVNVNTGEFKSELEAH